MHADLEPLGRMTRSRNRYRDGYRRLLWENRQLRETMPSLISFSLAGPSNAASSAARDAAVAKARALLA